MSCINSKKACFFFTILLVLAGCQMKTEQKLQETSSLEEEEKVFGEEKKTCMEPIADFKTRITKKPFGIFITPQNSPIQPERFSGYHTGVDVEYADTNEEVPVMAITDGEVFYSDWVSGYGGVMVIRHDINNQDYLVLYGHLDPGSLLGVNTQVLAGEHVAILGEGESRETDGERKHLHLAIYNDSDLNLKGYVRNETDLRAWTDPLTLF
ncbi:M23 family metallopeptidase [Patescibacteria group bacterium]|nr:M23 family metallopeptidase [Patescibacteria group bacterium]